MGEFRAIDESICADRSYGEGSGELIQSETACESALTDRQQGVRELHSGEACTACESGLTEGLDGIGERDAGNACAAEESAVSDISDAITDDDFFNIRIKAEGASAVLIIGHRAHTADRKGTIIIEGIGDPVAAGAVRYGNLSGIHSRNAVRAARGVKRQCSGNNDRAEQDREKLIERHI